MRGLARQKVLTVEVTVAASSSYVGFLEAYARALLTAETPVGRLRRWAMDLMQGVRPEVRIDGPSAAPASPRPAGSRWRFPRCERPATPRALPAEVFALPGRIAAARKQRLAVALDEFQAVAAFDGGNVEHALRAAVQDQRSVGYVFAGSEPSLMERMLEPRRPFYKAGPVVRLEKIDEDLFANFIDSRFTATGTETGGGPRRGDRGSGGQRAVRRAAAGSRDMGRRARLRPAEERGTRRSARHADAAAGRAATRRSRSRGNGSRWRSERCCAPWCSRAVASCCRGCAHASSPAGDVERAVGAGRAGPPGRGDAARQPLRGQRFAVPGVGGAQDVLTPQPTCVESPSARWFDGTGANAGGPSGRNAQLK